MQILKFLRISVPVLQIWSNDIQMSIFMWHNKNERRYRWYWFEVFSKRDGVRLIEFYGSISWCDSWQWLQKRMVTISFWTLHFKCITSIRISLNQASIIIAIDTIRKCLPFVDMAGFINNKISKRNWKELLKRSKKKHNYKLEPGGGLLAVRLHCVLGRWTIQMNQSKR